MTTEYQGQPIYIEGFRPPLTIDKLFGGFVGMPEGNEYSEYSAFVDHVLEQVGDIGPNEPIEGFDVRDGVYKSDSLNMNGVGSETSIPDSIVRETPIDMERLQSQNASLRDMNEKLHRVREKDKQDNQSVWWAMLALAVLIVAGFFGFGDY